MKLTNEIDTKSKSDAKSDNLNYQQLTHLTKILSRCLSPSPITKPMILIAAEECVNLCTVFHQWVGDVLEHLGLMTS